MGVWNGWGYGIAFFRALKFRTSEPENYLAKIALSAEFQGFSCKFRPLINIFRTLENGHSIRHQSTPPLSAGRFKIADRKSQEFRPNRRSLSWTAQIALSNRAICGLNACSKIAIRIAMPNSCTTSQSMGLF